MAVFYSKTEIALFFERYFFPKFRNEIYLNNKNGGYKIYYWLHFNPKMLNIKYCDYLYSRKHQQSQKNLRGNGWRVTKIAGFYDN